MTTLYFANGACSLAPHIVLEWIGAPYEAVKVQFGSPELLAVNPAGAAVHEPYLVAQAVARKERLGLWQFPDMPDPNAIILRQIREGAGATSGAPLPAPPPAR